MKLKLNLSLKDLIYAAIIIVVCIASLYTCNKKNKENAEQKKNLAFAKDMLHDNKSTWRKDSTEMGDKIAVQEVLYLSEKEAKELALIENDRLKKVKSEVKVITKTQIKKIYVPITDTFTVINGDTLKTRNFSVVDKWYALHGKVLPNQILIDSMSSNSEVVVTTGYEKQKVKGKLFKKSVLVVDVGDKNPNSNITGVYNVQVPPRKKTFLETRAAAAIGGAAAVIVGWRLIR